MRKTKFFTAVLAIMCVAMLACVLSGCTKKYENMLNTDDGVFRYETLKELKKDWILKTADSITDDSKVFTMNADADEDKYSLTINTSDSGWAYVGQRIKLDAGQYYHIKYDVDISKMAKYNVGTNNDGVFVSFIEDEDFNYHKGENQIDEAKLDQMQIGTGDSGVYDYGFKAKSTCYATIVLRVGTAENPSAANVTIRSFSVERCTQKDIIGSETEAGYHDLGSFSTDYYGVKSDFNVFYIVIGAIAIALICYFAYFAFQRHRHFTDPNGNGYTGFLAKVTESKFLGALIVAGIAAVVQVVTNVISTAVAAGYNHSLMGYNLEGLTTQAMFIAKYGPKDMGLYLSEYATTNTLTYLAPSSSALQLYLLGLAGLLGRIFDGVGGTYYATMFFIRFACTLADIGTVILIYNLVKKSVGNVGGMVIAGMYAILPVVFATSSVWGYLDSVTVFLIVLTVSFMLKNDYVATAITFFVACMFSMTALFMAPVVLFYTIMQCIVNKKNIIPASIILVLSFFVFYAINVPFDYNNITDGQPFYCFTKAWNELYKTALYSRNAFNFQTILGNNFATISTASIVVTIIFIVFLLGLVAFAYFKFKNRMNLVLMATAFINMLFVFGNNMNPVSMYVSLALMLIYAALNKEKRIFFSFVAFSVLMFINVSYAELFVEYSSTAVGIMGKTPTMYVFTVFELLLVLYYIYIVYDIVATRKVRRIQPMPLNYGEWLNNLGKRIKKNYYKLAVKLQKK